MMKINSTPKTPSVSLDSDKQLLEIKGISCPENPVQFYNPIIDELQRYLENSKTIQIYIHLDYFNTGSSKCLLNLFTMVSEHISEKSKAVVKWITEEGDFELMESGKIFQEMSGLHFEFENA